jgi:formiminotetrahydrofolate cyclodeaminase
VELVARVADPGSGAGAGAAAAMTAALAAGLVEKASGDERVPELRTRALELAILAEAAFGDAWDELSRAGAGGRDEELGGAMDRATAVPLEIASLAVQVAEIAVTAADRVAPILRAECVAATVLAESVCAVCAHLVKINLINANLTPVQEEARGYAGRAARARDALVS